MQITEYIYSNLLYLSFLPAIYFMITGVMEYYYGVRMNPSSEIIRISKNMFFNNADAKSVQTTSDNAMMKTSFGNSSTLVDSNEYSSDRVILKSTSKKGNPFRVVFKSEKRVHGGGWGL